MSHRKFEQPRHGSLQFFPRKRITDHQARIKSFPRDDASKAPHLTAFMGYKAGMTHVLREVQRVGSKLNKKETIECVTILETPAMIVCGLVGYVETPHGLRALTSVWAHQLSDNLKRRFYKNWYRAKGKAFTKYAALNYADGSKNIQVQLERIKKYCSVVRALVHTQIQKTQVGSKKAHLLEVQINGGTVAQKVDYAYSLFEKQVPVDSVFAQDEVVDAIGITSGKGFQGVISRWGVTALPRKTHRGLRKVACIGAWHPARIGWTVPRPGQQGYHKRTHHGMKIYRIGKACSPDGVKEIVNFNATTESDLTEKTINPMGGFVGYGNVNEDFLMIKGSIIGPKKRVITLRKAIKLVHPNYAKEPAGIKFIDTSSKMGRGVFQTSDEKKKFYAM